MKPRLIDLLACPACRGALALADASREGEEIVSGALACPSCVCRYAIREGVPRFLGSSTDETTRTAKSFGYLWAQSPPDDPDTYHFHKIQTALELQPLHGRVLDGGCGDGIDLRLQARRSGVDIVGVELSEGGCRASAARIRDLPNAHVVQADLARLPFADGTFDVAYSYGVLHHLARPSAGARELVRVTAPGGDVAVYLYEDFAERATILRLALNATNSARAITTRLPNQLLYAACVAASPIVFTLFTIPHRIIRRVRVLQGVANALPFRHGTSPFGLRGDLYDRFSAPVELRYSRADAVRLLNNAGLDDIRVANDRGWMVSGHK